MLTPTSGARRSSTEVQRAWFSQSRTASDQHQPASSRAMAVLATTARLRRASKPDPAVRAGGGWPAVRGRGRPGRRRPGGGAARRRSGCGGRWCQAASISSRRACPLPVLVIDPWRREAPGGGLGGHQPEVGADRAAGQPVPVADLDRQPERGQRGDPAQAAQPGHHRGVVAAGGHLGDRHVEPVPAGRGGQHRVVGDVERGPQPRPCRTPTRGAGRAATGRAHRSTPCRRSRRSPGAAAVSTADAAPTSDPRGRPRGRGPDPAPPPAPRWAPSPRRSRPGAAAGPDAGHRARRS